jgi:translation elongation factor P/translation initiation factor 5A
MINGLFTSDISKTDYLQLENNFKKSNISSLKEHYSAHHTDDEAVTVTFIKNRKIVKTVYDYGRDAPSEFIWAYTLIRYFYQKVKLSPLKADKIYSLVQEISFETKNKVCNLTASECFYLFTELQNGRNINHTFEEKYKIDFWNDQHAAEIVYTDGRFFKFMDKNKRITIDLGYNFLTENNLTNRFKTKKTYQ